MLLAVRIVLVQYLSVAHCAVDVVNGQRNDIFVTVENKSDRNVTLQNIAGSLHHPDTNRLVKNVRDKREVDNSIV